MTQPIQPLTVYTAVFGNSDTLAPVALKHRLPSVRYVCFTDQPITADGWEVQRRNIGRDSPRRESRWYKMHPHRLFEGPTVWIDGSCAVRGDLRGRTAALQADVACFRHPSRRDIFREATAAARRSDCPDRVQAEVARYRIAGHPAGFGLWACGVLLRRPTPEQREFDERWYRLYCEGGDRDQISFAQAVWETGHSVELLPGALYDNRYVCVRSHRPKRRMRWDLINALLQQRNGTRYLEIGCRDDRCFRRVHAAQKVGVDPEHGGTHRMTSDDFFAHYDGPPFDVIFIDGLHQCLQVIRDAHNALRHLAPNGAIVLHDCLPEKEEHQITHHPQTGELLTGPPSGKPWNGDVWKAAVALRTADVDLATCNADYGLGVLLKRPATAPTFDMPCPLTWQHYTTRRDELLRVMDWDAILKFAG